MNEKTLPLQEVYYRELKERIVTLSDMIKEREENDDWRAATKLLDLKQGFVTSLEMFLEIFEADTLEEYTEESYREHDKGTTFNREYDVVLEENPKPCPSCGTDPTLYMDEINEKFGIYCPNQKCDFFKVIKSEGETIEEVVDDWNGKNLKN